MKTLVNLYEVHAGYLSDKWSSNLREYDRIFSSLRDQPISMMEIGIQNGGSLEIWSQFFRNGEKFVGCDINPNCNKLKYEDSRINVVVGDASSLAISEQIKSITSKFDIIIDDGSHLSGEIVKSFARYFSYLPYGGIYVVEDLHCSYWSEFEGGLFYPYSSMAFFKRLADVINQEHWGVDKSRVEILSGILLHYGCDLKENDLSEVHSIEFINSMCVIRKRAAVDNILGCRNIAGVLELVVSGHRQLKYSSYKLPDHLNQSENQWSIRLNPPDEEIEHIELALRDARRQTDELKLEIANMTNSLSWRFAVPFRFLDILLKNYLQKLKEVMGKKVSNNE